MDLLACSGPGAGATISRNIEFAYGQAACGALLAAVSLGLCLAACRRRLYPALCAALLAVHPAWTVSALGGDCGALKAGAAVAFTGAAALLVVAQLAHGAVTRHQHPGRAEVAPPPPIPAHPPGGEDRPWEQPGAVRRDCEPHRGAALLLLGRVSLGCGLLGLLGVTAPLGLALGCAVMALSEHDRGRMRAGEMDPAGGSLVAHADRYAAWGVVLSLFFGVAWAALLLTGLF
jgi:hypothetical protein